MGIKDHIQQEIIGFEKLKVNKMFLDYRRWLLKEGTLFTEVNEMVSRVLAKKFSCEIKSCYKNVFLISFCNEDFEFWEGYMYDIRLPMPIEHAWLVKDGVVLDPTMCISNDTMKKQIKRKCSKEFNKVFKAEPEMYRPMTGIEYFGVNIPVDFVNKHYDEFRCTRDTIGAWYRLQCQT